MEQKYKLSQIVQYLQELPTCFLEDSTNMVCIMKSSKAITAITDGLTQLQFEDFDKELDSKYVNAMKAVVRMNATIKKAICKQIEVMQDCTDDMHVTESIIDIRAQYKAVSLLDLAEFFISYLGYDPNGFRKKFGVIDLIDIGLSVENIKLVYTAGYYSALFNVPKNYVDAKKYVKDLVEHPFVAYSHIMGNNDILAVLNQELEFGKLSEPYGSLTSVKNLCMMGKERAAKVQKKLVYNLNQNQCLSLF